MHRLLTVHRLGARSVALVAVAAALGVLVWALPGPAGAEQRRIGPGADLAAALAALAPGDTLVLAPGVHRLDVDVEVTAAGRPGEPITVRGQGGRDRVEVAGTGRLTLSAASHWVIEDVTFRSVPLLLTSDDELGHPFDTRVVDNRFVGRGLELRNAGSVEIEGNQFVDVRSRRAGEDRHAIQLLGASGDVAIRGNAVTDAGADAIHAAGRTDNVLVEGNELRIVRPRPASDPLCNTGENAIDIRSGDGWVIRDNVVSGYHVVPGCEDFDAATEGGDAVAIHGAGGRDVEISGNRFADNTVHVLVLGRTCGDEVGGCRGDLRTERVEVRANDFRSDGIPGRATGVRVTPGAGTASLEPPVAPVDVTVADNTFVGLDIVVDVVARNVDTDDGEVLTRPGDVVVERNSHIGGRMKLAAAARVTASDNTSTPADPPATTAATATAPTTAQAPTTATGASTADVTGTGAGAGGSATAPPDATPGEPVGEPDLEREFPWPWLGGTAALIVGAAVGGAVWRARQAPPAEGRAEPTGYGPGDG